MRVNNDNSHSQSNHKNVENQQNDIHQTNDAHVNQDETNESLIDLTNSSMEDNDDPNDADYHPGDEILATMHQIDKTHESSEDQQKQEIEEHSNIPTISVNKTRGLNQKDIEWAKTMAKIDSDNNSRICSCMCAKI